MSIYERFGARPVINATGSVTRLGGALMTEAAIEAYRQAASASVSIEDLQAAASRTIARVTGAEAGLVTSGAAAALTLGTAAILTGFDPGRIERLPHCGEMPSEFLIARNHRSGYDHAIRAAGAQLVEVGFDEMVAGAGVRGPEAWEYEAAITERTVGIAFVARPGVEPSLPDVVRVARAHDLPVLVDAAGELPPRSNLRSFLEAGADLVAFSGGKAIQGPGATGILCGRRKWVGAAALNMLDMDDHFSLWDPPAELIRKSELVGMPRHGIGRAMKVAKEAVVALLVALEEFAEGPSPERLAAQRDVLESVVAGIADLPVNCRIADPRDGETLPLLHVRLDPPWVPLAFQLCKAFREGDPPVYVGHAKLDSGVFVINPLCLNAAQAEPMAGTMRAGFERLVAEGSAPRPGNV